MKHLSAIAMLLGIFVGLFSSCEPPQRHVERPRDTWVLRSVLDQNPRMMSIALHDNLWLAYSTQFGGLYKVWDGSVNFEGAVYTTAHGPQPTSSGAPFLIQTVENPWRLIVGDETITPEVQYRGHTIQNNQVILNYELAYKGQKIEVRETPEYLPIGAVKTGLERKFMTANVPEGVEVALKVKLTSVQTEGDYSTDGQLAFNESNKVEVEGIPFLEMSGLLKLNKNGETTYTARFTKRPIKAQLPETANAKKEVETLFAQSDCNTCHNEKVKTVGPSYIDIAKKYPNSEDKLQELIEKVLEGGSGNWGQVPMTPHPDLAKEDAAKMVSYILSLDADEEQEAAVNNLMPAPDFKLSFQKMDKKSMTEAGEQPGIAINAYVFPSIAGFMEIPEDMKPVVSGTANALHAEDSDFGELSVNFYMEATGFLNLEEDRKVVLRLVSDDGSRMFINGNKIIHNGGFHALAPKEAEITLKKGRHPFKVEYYQGGGGKAVSLQWKPYGEDEFSVVPPELFTYNLEDIKETKALPDPNVLAGDTKPLLAVHPSFDLAQARPESFQPKVGGMDFLPDGRLVVSTWDSLGAIYVLEGVQADNPEAIKVTQVAAGFAEPLGVKVVEGDIYILQKQELTRLRDLNGDGIMDEYYTVSNDWKVSANFHEFAFGLEYKDGYFYATLATAIQPGGASTNPQIPDRGKVVKISIEDGSTEFIAQGLRTPNGIGVGVDGEMFIADNQGDWLPASKIVHVQKGAWYGSRSVDFEGTEGLEETRPVVWLPQDEIGNSPSEPIYLNVGPYQNQMLHGEVTHGGLKRVFTEKINGQYQGVVFRFTQGIEAGVNRVVWGPDDALYIGGIGNPGNWGHFGGKRYGLQRMKFNGKSTFEMLAVRAQADGVEIEFTEPLKEGVGEQASDYAVNQWYYLPTENYGGPKLDEKVLNISDIQVSEDRKKVKLQLQGMESGHVVYIRLNKATVKSAKDQTLWTTEAWYTMNRIPQGEEVARQ
ncbi:PA14 domain-containing protein [Rapidithrix thailandica]|uniref:PA14 domain-containing protein n=1 Tax=Rapidithrix thailandica TaxID=413964 RepID=A0AAW9S6I5_9BACT